MLKYSDNRTRILINWSLLAVAVVWALGVLVYRLPPPGCGVSWRVLSMIDHATQVDTYRCGLEPKSYGAGFSKTPLGIFEGYYIYEKGSVNDTRFAHKIYQILRNPKTFGHDVFPCFMTSPVAMGLKSASGMVDVVFTFDCPYASITARDRQGQIIEEDTAESSQSTPELLRLAKQAFPKMTMSDYDPTPPAGPHRPPYQKK